ncbi:MAG: hemolysin III family protein, partial [Devosia sp.]
LAVLGGTPMATVLTVFVWGASLIGVALKLIVPHRFGRLAIALYLAIGWSGIFVFQSLAQTLPPLALWLVLAGGIVYSLGIIFHLWEKLKFQNVLWHVFVVAGACLHLWAVLDTMVFSRL